jgi:hypothetical protein
MNPEQREEVMRRLEKGEDLSSEWARILFPPEKREYELVYHGKEREEDSAGFTDNHKGRVGPGHSEGGLCHSRGWSARSRHPRCGTQGTRYTSKTSDLSPAFVLKLACSFTSC